MLDKFDALLGEVIDRVLGIRSTTTGYQYSEIICSIFALFMCGGDANDLIWAYG